MRETASGSSPRSSRGAQLRALPASPGGADGPNRSRPALSERSAPILHLTTAADRVPVMVAPGRSMRGVASLATLDPDDGEPWGLNRKGEPAKASLVQRSLRKVIDARSSRHAHFVCYYVEDADGVFDRAPRLTKDVVGQVREAGADVLMWGVAIDWDLKDHPPLRDDPSVRRSGGGKIAWADLPSGRREAVSRLVDEASDALAADGCPWNVFYTTPHGARFLHVFPEPVPAGPGFENLARKVRELHVSAGLHVDNSCKDWTRFFACPMVTLPDGTRTWEQPWFEVEEQWDEFYLPDEEDLEAPDEPVVRVVPVDADRPDPEQARDLVEVVRQDGERKLTDAAKAARKEMALEPAASCFDAVFNHAPLASQGSRHTTLLASVGETVARIHGYGWAKPELVYALLLPAADAMGADDDGTPFSDKLWEMSTSIWAKEDAKSRVRGGESLTEPDPTRAPTNHPNLDLDADGKPYQTLANTRKAIALLGVTLAYDEFGDRLLVGGLEGFGPYLDDRAVSRLWLAVEESFRLKVGKDRFWTIVEDLAMQNRRHPVREYLDGLEWDGTPRIDRWLVDYMGADDGDYVRAVARIILLAAVRRARRPGCKFDEMPVLEGPQGTRKSMAIAALAVQPGWFSDDLPLSAKTKEFIEATIGKWIVEAGELKGMRKCDVEGLKACLSRSVDRARMAYGRLPVERARQFVMIGTTNSDRYLRDNTGNRRFWPVRIGEVSLTALRRDRDQLWAEAAHREAQGESIRLDPTLYSAAAGVQEARRLEDPFLHTLRAKLGEREGRLLVDDARTLVGVRAAQSTQDTHARIGEVMRELGWERSRLRHDGSLQYCYVRGRGPWLRVTETVAGDVRVAAERGQA